MSRPIHSILYLALLLSLAFVPAALADADDAEAVGLELGKSLCEALEKAAEYAREGKFKRTVSEAEKVLKKEKSSDGEKSDAKTVIETVNAHFESLFQEVEKMLSDRLAWDAALRLEAMTRAFRGMDDFEEKAEKKLKEVKSRKSLKEDLRAGKLYHKALEYSGKGKRNKAKLAYYEVVKKYPKTAYAEKAKEMLLCQFAGPDDKIKPGVVTKVTCRDDNEQTYACYLPASYNPKAKYPVLFCFHPAANGLEFVYFFKEAAEKRGWIVVSSNNSKNGPVEPAKKATAAVWKDVTARLSADEKKCFSTGFSGGSWVAGEMAASYPENIAGVIPIGISGGWASHPPEIPKGAAVLFLNGDRDGGIAAAKTLCARYKEEGRKAELITYPGGHVFPPKEMTHRALEWMEKNCGK